MKIDINTNLTGHIAFTGLILWIVLGISGIMMNNGLWIFLLCSPLWLLTLLERKEEQSK